ncbi:MAG TPA: L-2-hydroxyglutarate oxidase [Candidatus Didemnitutus sp.]|jgi:L-2-hydroxyglutarate oxidase
MSTANFDHIVIGGGIVGLATAWALMEREPKARVAVLEKEEDWARHQTGRNSGVIHSGIYYKPGSLKAQMCREGNRRILEFCRAYGIPFDICGKVIVATSPEELPGLQKLHDRGVANGLGVKKLAPEAVSENEPHVRCVEGVLVPSTGIVSYAAICRKLAELIGGKGGSLHLGTRVTGFRRDSADTVVETTQGEFAARTVVNCAGLHSDRVVRLAGARPTAKIVPFRGEYYEIRPERRSLVKNLIYPVPDPQFPFLGVHFTRMIDGSVHAGPNAVLSMKREGYHRTSFNLRDFAETMTYGGFWKLAAKHAAAGLREMHRSFSKAAFVRSLQQLIPEIQADDLVPGEAGVRAQALLPDGGLVDDFLIIREASAVHVCNAPSPAATASLEIGRYVAAQVPGNG